MHSISKKIRLKVQLSHRTCPSKMLPRSSNFDKRWAIYETTIVLPKIKKQFSILMFEKLIFAGHLGEKTAYFGLNFFQKILVFDWEPKKNF